LTPNALANSGTDRSGVYFASIFLFLS